MIDTTSTGPAPGQPASGQWDVRVEDGTVIVDLPPRLEMDEQTGVQINEAFSTAVGRPEATRVLTLLRVEDPMGSGLFEEVKKGGNLAVEGGITRWAIVVERKIKGMAFEGHLEGLETALFEKRAEAEEWLLG